MGAEFLGSCYSLSPSAQLIAADGLSAFRKLLVGDVREWPLKVADKASLPGKPVARD